MLPLLPIERWDNRGSDAPAEEQIADGLHPPPAVGCVQRIVRDALQKLRVPAVGHRELEGKLPTRRFLDGA